MPLLPPLRARFARKTILVLAAIDAALVGLGLGLAPTTLTASRQGWMGVGAALAMLAAYAVVGVTASPALERRHPRLLHVAGFFGLSIGLIFLVEMLLEYAFVPGSKGNERFGYLEFGGMFLCLFLAGLKGGQQTGKIRDGVLATIGSTMIGSLIWVGSLLSTYYVFYGTARQEKVLAADQVLEDFARSGMTDLRAFIMQDYLGGVFFHLLFGLIAAALVGSIGGVVAKLARRSDSG